MADIRRAECGGVLTLTFTRDTKLNAVSPAMLDGLRAAVDELAESSTLRVLLIGAEGRYFTAGMDLADAAAMSQGEDGTLFRRGYRALHLLFDEVEAVEKPVVLAAQGPCWGVGLEMAVSCDFRLAAQAASFRLPEVANLGVIPGSGGLSRLRRLVGPHWTAWLAIAGQEVDAEQAKSIGLVHAVYSNETFAGRAAAFAQALAELPSEAVALAKLSIKVSESADRASARDFDRVANTILVGSADHRRLASRLTKTVEPAPEANPPHD